MNKRLDRIARALRMDRGSLLSTMAFILVTTGISALMLGFFLTRSSSDFAASQRANAKSAISQYSAQLLGEINRVFPTEWQTMPPDELKAATQSLSDFEELRSEVWVDGFSLNVTTGIVVVDLVGETTTVGHIAVGASMKLVPSGSAVFTGVDASGRPVWIYSDDQNLDSLALWELAPDGMQYIDPNGADSPTAPAEVPAVSLNGTEAGVRADIGSVSCRYGQFAEYQYRTNPGTGYKPWTDWSTVQRFDFPLSEGEYIQVQARARCVAPGAPGDRSPTSPAISYAKPITTVLAGPQIAVTPEGVASWPSVVCSAAATPEYRWQRALNGGPYNAWSAWGSGRAFTTVLPEGNLLEAQVQAHCVTPHVTGPNSSTGYASAISPLTSVAEKPTVTLTPALSAVFAGASCPAGTTPEYRWRSAINDQSLPMTWSAWSSTAGAALTADEGSRIKVQASARCATAYATGPSSPESAVATRDIAVTSVAGQPTVTLAANGTSFTWSDAACPAGTAGLYDWKYQANGGAVVATAPGWKAKPASVAVAINQGGTLRVWMKAACEGFTGVGPASAERASDFAKAITTAPSAATVSLDGNAVAYWSSRGCPTGTSLQTQWRRAINYGGWAGFSAWATDASAGPLAYYDTAVIVGVNSRCVNLATNQFGPANYGESAWFVRGIPTPGYAGGFSGGVGLARTIYWNPVSCAAGRPYYQTFYRFENYQYANADGYGTSYTRPPVGSNSWRGYMYYGVSTICLGTYANSAWTGYVSEYRPD